MDSSTKNTSENHHLHIFALWFHGDDAIGIHRETSQRHHQGCHLGWVMQTLITGVPDGWFYCRMIVSWCYFTWLNAVDDRKSRRNISNRHPRKAEDHDHATSCMMAFGIHSSIVTWYIIRQFYCYLLCSKIVVYLYRYYTVVYLHVYIYIYVYCHYPVPFIHFKNCRSLPCFHSAKLQ